jgi:lysozyme
MLGQMTTLHPRLTKAAIELVKSFEGLRPKAARLPGGGWTIGYGHTLSAREGAEVTAKEAEALLLYDLDKTARAVDALIATGTNANQFAALTAFAFNIGLENFKASAVLRLVNQAAFLQAAAAIELWRRADLGGDPVLVDGLVRRRAAEKALFLTPPEGFKPVSTPVLRAALDAQPEADLAGAADLWVSLEGDEALVERTEAPGAATTEAIRAVTARLSALFPDEDAAEATPAIPGADALTPEPQQQPQPEPEPEPELQPEPEPEPVAEVAAETEPEPEPEPEPAPEPANEFAPITVAPPAPELVLAPAPAYDEPEPESAPVPAPPPPPAEDEAPPRLFQPETYVPYDDQELPEVFQRRPSALAAEDAETVYAPVAAQPAPSLHAPVTLLVGLGGVVMFVGSLAAMVYGKATLTNLVIGLLGVVCMAPAGLKLLLKLFGERGPDQDA